MIDKTVNIVSYVLVLAFMIELSYGYTIIQIDDNQPEYIKDKKDHNYAIHEVKRGIREYEVLKRHIGNDIKKQIGEIKQLLGAEDIKLKSNIREVKRVKRQHPVFIVAQKVPRGFEVKNRVLKYEPLFRTHKRKLIKTPQEKYANGNSLLQNPRENWHLFEPTKKPKVNELTIKRQIAEFIHKNFLQHVSKQDFGNFLMALIRDAKKKDGKDELRIGKFIDKSGEVFDPLAPGNDDEEIPSSDALVYSAKEIVLPEYAPWDYWTYQKTIVHDQCKENQIQIGGECVWVPPH